jgi:hypothetical protein
MNRSVEDIISALTAFEPTDDGADNVHGLIEALDGFAALPGNEAAMRAMFALLERFPGADFGTPGPLVHELEAQPAFPALLAASLESQPTELTAWMANRLLNSRLSREDRGEWLKRLTVVTSHPRASKAVRESAIRFLDFQASRSGQAG